MKFYYCAALFLVFLSCHQPGRDRERLQARIDILEKKLAETYNPGLGEFMNNVQLHHSKLWFAGVNGNWDLAAFEIHEIDETIEDIQHFAHERPEVRAIDMIDPAIESVTDAVARHDEVTFKTSYYVLTNTCNKCHVATEHGFNVITIPTQPPVTDQSFRPQAH